MTQGQLLQNFKDADSLIKRLIKFLHIVVIFLDNLSTNRHTLLVPFKNCILRHLIHVSLLFLLFPFLVVIIIVSGNFLVCFA